MKVGIFQSAVILVNYGLSTSSFLQKLLLSGFVENYPGYLFKKDLFQTNEKKERYSQNTES